MPVVNLPRRKMTNGQEITDFYDSVGTTSVRYTYTDVHDGITVYNDGSASLTLNVNGTIRTIAKGSTEKVYEKFDSFSIVSTSGVQAFRATAFVGDGGMRNAPINIEVSTAYTSATEGWGVTRFSSLIDATNYISSKSNYFDPYYIKAYAGNFADFGTRFPGYDAAKPYTGIIVSENVTIEGIDQKLCTITWDGYDGHGAGTMTDAETQQKCPFHIVGVNVTIRGFTIICTNTRYCLHVESNGTVKRNKILLADLILDYRGRPNNVAPSYTTPVLGCGISPGETLEIRNVRCISLGAPLGGGIYIHNNPWNTTTNGPRPDYVPPAKFILDNVDPGEGKINIESVSSNGETSKDIGILKDIRNGGILFLGHQALATQPTNLRYNWDLSVQGSSSFRQLLVQNRADGEDWFGKIPALDITETVSNDTGSAIGAGTHLAYAGENSVKPIAASGELPVNYAGKAITEIPANGKKYTIQSRGIIDAFMNSGLNSTLGYLLGVPAGNVNRFSQAADRQSAIAKALEVGTSAATIRMELLK